jgi:ribulose-5-phosphate 4-epimerase/fuculose-1-phosphate aldolase
MTEQLSDLRHELALANRILAHEGVLDAFGHISLRHPTDPSRFFLSRHRAPPLVEPGDILEFNLDSEPVTPTEKRLYGERVIHGSIYKVRPDVRSVVHHHAPAIMPFAVSGMDIVPVYHMGSVVGPKVPLWDSRDDFGDTSLLVTKPEEGASLAKALGPYWTVLMRRHGATVAGTSLHETVYRAVYGCDNAEFQWKAHALGEVGALSAIEAEKASAYVLQPGPVARAWEYWSMRVAQAGQMPAR